MACNSTREALESRIDRCVNDAMINDHQSVFGCSSPKSHSEECVESLTGCFGKYTVDFESLSQEQQDFLGSIPIRKAECINIECEPNNLLDSNFCCENGKHLSYSQSVKRLCYIQCFDKAAAGSDHVALVIQGSYQYPYPFKDFHHCNCECKYRFRHINLLLKQSGK